MPIVALAGNAAADLGMVLTTLSFLAVSLPDLKRFSKSRFLRLSTVFWVWILFCSAISAFPSHSFQDSLPWIRFPLYAYALSHLIGRKGGQYLRYFVIAAVLGTLIEMAFIVHEYFFVRGDLARLHGTFGKLIAGWYLDCFSLIVILWGFEKIRQGTASLRLCWFIGLFTALTAYGVLITGEIMSTLFFVGTIGLYWVLQRPYSARKLGLIVAGLAVPLAGGLLVSHFDPILQERLIHSIVARLPWMESSDYHLPWTSGLYMGLENPILGIGPKNFNPYCLTLKDAGTLPALLHVSECQWHPHNLYLQLMAEAGLPGLILFSALAVYVFVAAYRHSVLTHWTENLSLVLAFVLFFPIQTYSQAFGQSKNFYFWTMLGFVLSLIRQHFYTPAQDERL